MTQPILRSIPTPQIPPAPPGTTGLHAALESLAAWYAEVAIAAGIDAPLDPADILVGVDMLTSLRGLGSRLEPAEGAEFDLLLPCAEGAAEPGVVRVGWRSPGDT